MEAYHKPNTFYAAIHTSYPSLRIPKISDNRDPRAQMPLTGYMLHHKKKTILNKWQPFLASETNLQVSWY